MTLFRLTHSHKMAQFEGIPGPEPGLPLGNAGDFLHRWPWEVCAEYGRTYGGMALCWLMGTPAIVLNDPALIGRVLDSDSNSYYKDAPHDAVAPVITEGDLFISNGEAWRGLRAASPLNSSYTKAWLQAQVPAVRNVAMQASDSLAGQTVPDLIEPIRRIVYDAISSAVWGEPLGDQNYHDFMKMARVGHGRMVEPPVLPLDPIFYIDRDRWYASYRERVERATTQSDAGHSHLLRVALRAGPTVPLDQLAHWLSAPIYFGGVFSVASGIAHTLGFLASDPEAFAAVLAELRLRQPLSPNFDAAALEGCERLDHALRESLRLSSPVTLFFRNVLKERAAELGGRPLPPDTLIFITNWLLHHDPGHWEDAEQFRPDRWARGGVARDPLGSEFFFPFGRGPRACVGQDFALFLMKMVLAVLLSRTRVLLDLSRSQESDFFFAVQHPKELKARFERK